MHKLPEVDMEEALSLQDAEKQSWIRRIPPEVWIFAFYFLVTVFLTWPIIIRFGSTIYGVPSDNLCLLYTSDAADDLLCVDLGGRRIIKKKKRTLKKQKKKINT